MTTQTSSVTSTAGASTNASARTRMHRIVTVLVFAACAACLAVDFLSKSNMNMNMSASDTRTTSSSHQHNHHERTNFHQSGFGGIHNIAHPAGAKARRELSETNVIIPQAANSFATPSLARENIENHHGHYVHDEHQSPFASFLYNLTKEELEAEQADYVKRMAEVRVKWGAWNFNDEHPEIRPIANFEKTPYRDMKNTDFPKKSWQTDEKYVKDFIKEGKDLVDRVREGIYAEYGWPKSDDEEKMKERDIAFEVQVTEEVIYPARGRIGVATMNKKGMDNYARKLLHAMMTNDEFYYILGGHSAAAGHGNNFHQTYLMEFANIMEPVLHKLGVRLIARNLAMGGLGTTHFSLGANTLYGEADVMVWDSGMTEKSAADQDLFHKQVMLGGERFPVLISGSPLNLDTETGGNLWYGTILEGFSGVPVITDMDMAEQLPWAAQEFICDPSVKDLCGRGLLDECWVPRSDFTPTTRQNAHVGGKAGWHPGWRTHKYTARKHTLMMLRALDQALDTWMDEIETTGFPLKEEVWHTGPINEAARSNLIAYINDPEKGFNTTECEKRWAPRFGLDRACRMSIKGMGQETPTNRGRHNSIAAYIKPASNGYKPDYAEEPLYEGVDVLPREWIVPKGEVDVHAIAIVSTYAPPALDQSWTDDNGDADSDAEEADASRRMLRKAATELLSVPSKSESGSDAALNAEEGAGFGAGAVAGIAAPRVLAADDDRVFPGQGWALMSESTSKNSYCDGSPVSWCKRTTSNNCLMYGHNDGRPVVAGDGQSGWIVITIPEVKEGLIFARMEWWRQRGGTTRGTKTWTEYNNGVQDRARQRELGGKIAEWPEDSEVQIAVNNKIIKTYNKTEFLVWRQEIAYNEAFYPLMDDKDFVKGDKPVSLELGIRVRSETDPIGVNLAISHIYYA